MKKSPKAAIIGLVILTISIIGSPVRADVVKTFPSTLTAFHWIPFTIAIIGIYSGIFPGRGADVDYPAGSAEAPIVIDEVGLAVSWDPDVLSWIFPNVIDPWDPGKTVIHVDNEVGLANIFVKSTEGVSTEQFPIVSITFNPIGLGTTDIIIDTTSGDCATGLWGECGVFADGDEVPLEYINGSVTVVPVTATVWLMASGLLGLLGIRIKRKRASIER